MKVGISCDHRGFYLKNKLIEYLTEKGFKVIDYGTNSVDSADYPLYGIKLGEKVASKEVDYGIAICGSGIGISIACNKVIGVRCAKVNTVKETILCRRDNNANIIAISGTMSLIKVKKIIDTFFETDFLNIKRYVERIKQITKYEEDDNER